MTTCAECLTAVSTMRLADMRADSPIALHCASCPYCSDVVRETVYAEQRLSEALHELRPSMSVQHVSAYAINSSEKIRRLWVARWVRGVLAAAGCVTFFFFMQNVFIPRVDPSSEINTESITLRCISAQQASEIATPYLRSHGSAIYRADELHTVTIRGQQKEFAAAVAHVQLADDRATCDLPAIVHVGGSGGSDMAPVHVNDGDAAPVPTPPPTTTSSDKPKKD